MLHTACLLPLLPLSALSTAKNQTSSSLQLWNGLQRKCEYHSTRYHSFHSTQRRNANSLFVCVLVWSVSSRAVCHLSRTVVLRCFPGPWWRKQKTSPPAHTDSEPATQWTIHQPRWRFFLLQYMYPYSVSQLHASGHQTNCNMRQRKNVQFLHDDLIY